MALVMPNNLIRLLYVETGSKELQIRSEASQATRNSQLLIGSISETLLLQHCVGDCQYGSGTRRVIFKALRQVD
jgi:hypothetical protein